MIATLFDFDGVLVDSEPSHLAAFNDVLGPYGVTIDPRTYAERYLSLDDAGVFRDILSLGGRTPAEQEVQALVAAKSPRFLARFASGFRVFPGATEIVAHRAERGPVGIVSGALQAEISFALEKMGIATAVSFVVSAEQTPVSKPDPAPYRLALDTLRSRGHVARAVVVEDSLGGVLSAKRAGLRCVAVTHSCSAEALARAGADAIVLKSGGADRRNFGAGRVTDSALAFAAAMHMAFASPGADAWKRAEVGSVRGLTIGPIESAYHPGVGYGSAAYDRAVSEGCAMGATWIAVTPFGRVADLSGTGVDLTFEVPFERNVTDVVRAIRMAHARGLRVMLVPHLWVESGDWRGLIDPKTDEAWARWAESYERFARAWAEVAEATHTELFSVGVELRAWVTTTRAPSFTRVVQSVRRVYHGMLTYSANWDDVEDTVVLGSIDVIGINAFYPLAGVSGASAAALSEGGRRARDKVHAIAERWGKPVLFTETGYTTRPDPAVRPWEWPDTMTGVKVDEAAQATAYRALVAPLLDEPDFAGFFVWRVYADPDDVSQEPPWGFSPRGKLAELIVRDAFAASWSSDPWWRPRWGPRAQTPGIYP